MKTISRYIMTLALLLTAVTGAWATDGKVYDSSVNISTLQVGDILIEGAQITISNQTHDLQFMSCRYFLNAETTPNTSYFQCDQTATVGANGLMTGLNYGATARPADAEGKEGNAWEVTAVTANSTLIVGITYTAEAPLTVDWNASTKTGTFAMPGSDVVLTPQYAPTAKWDVVETVPQQPAALEGIIAGQDAAIVTPGQSAQGTVMYAVTTTAEAAPALEAFSATVPTAKTYDDATTLYVWYYIQGADAPQGQEATEENTFNDSEISATPLTVQVLTNKFDIQFTAANDNTIEAGKATVTVGGTDKTSDITDGKLQGVKMGSEVKLEAKPGYKFRKVEVKKKAAAVRPLAEATAEDLGKIAGADGNIYDTKAAAEAAGTTAVAMIAYVGSSTEHATYTHGMALALSDEGEMNWSNAKSTCEGKSAVSGAAWLLPSRNQWKAMFKANGGNEGSYTGLNTAVATAGGDSSKLQKNERYWSSSEQGSNFAWVLVLGEDNAGWDGAPEDLGHHVRACLAF